MPETKIFTCEQSIGGSNINIPSWDKDLSTNHDIANWMRKLFELNSDVVCFPQNGSNGTVSDFYIDLESSKDYPNNYRIECEYKKIDSNNDHIGTEEHRVININGDDEITEYTVCIDHLADGEEGDCTIFYKDQIIDTDKYKNDKECCALVLGMYISKIFAILE